MALGLPVSKTIIDNQAGSQIVRLLQAFEECDDFKKKFLDLTAAPVGGVESYLKNLPTDVGQNAYSDAEITTLRNVYTLISQLYQVAQGQTNVPNPVNFFFDAQKLIGPNVT